MEAIELDPNLGVANLHLGVIYLQRGHRDLAYNALIRAQALSPDNPVGEQAAQLLAKYFQE